MSAPDLVTVDDFGLETPGTRLAVVTMNRPADLNPFDWRMATRLKEHFDRLDADPGVRVVALTGAGRAFSAGGDLKKYVSLQRDTARFAAFLDEVHQLFLGIGAYATPFISLINGTAVAAGLELVTFTDTVFMAESAVIGDGHLRFGMMGGGGALTWLPRVIGPLRAKELVLSGRMLSAAEAREWGLVNKVVEDGKLIEAALEYANGVARSSPLAIAQVKRVMHEALVDGYSARAALRLEAVTTTHYCATSDDAQEGLSAFIEKRTPRFLGK